MHDDAYRWAERRRLEQHPHTGAAQLVEIREVVREIEVPRYVAAERAVFAGVPDSRLLEYGVLAGWLDDVKQVADEDALLALADHLPAEAAEALLELATGSGPAIAPSGRRGRRPPVQLAFPVDRVEPRGRRLAARKLGTVSGRAAARSEDFACPNGSARSSGRTSPRWPPLWTSTGS